MTHDELHNMVINHMLCDQCTEEDEERYWPGSADSMRWIPNPDLSGTDERR